MKKKIKQEGIKKYIEDASPEKCFWVNNGSILKNLQELAFVLPKMSSATFKHHVNKEKNDFSKWAAEVIGHKELARDLSKAKTKSTSAKVLNRYI